MVVGVPSLWRSLTLNPTPQICPVLYHAGMVLLNSLLDTVPGELALAGRGAPGRAWDWNGGEEEAGYAAARQGLRVGPCHAWLQIWPLLLTGHVTLGKYSLLSGLWHRRLAGDASSWGLF